MTEQEKRHNHRVEVCNQLSILIDTSDALQGEEHAIVHDAHALLMRVILRLDALERAAASLAAGVEELQEAWPNIAELPPGSPLNDYIGFLFATLPLTQKALR